MELNPVFINELRQSIVRRKPITALAIWACIMAVIIYFSQFAGASGDMFAMLPQFVLPLIVPTFTAGVFAKEYEQQTWQDLYLTRLTNWQVVTGKFMASLLLSSLAAFLFIPSIMLMLVVKAGYNPAYMAYLTPGWWTLKMSLYLFVSTMFYVLVAMVCSRYSTNRRMATVVCYVSLFLYAFLCYVMWKTAGGPLAGQRYPDYSYSSGYRYGDFERGLPLPDPMGNSWMQMMHLIFGGVIGGGSALLLWVSLSEQRGIGVGLRQRSSEHGSPSPIAANRAPKLRVDFSVCLPLRSSAATYFRVDK